MTTARILRIYLDDIPRQRAERGNFNIINKICDLFHRFDFRVELCRNTAAERMKSATRNGYSLFLMEEPFHARALTLRKAYFYPFWRIENTAKRWQFEIARSKFDPEKTDPSAAKSFCDSWRKKLLPEAKLGAAAQGFVYVPLQGRLMDHRSFQSVSPIDMLGAVLRQDSHRRVVATLHPGETYLPEEHDALHTLAKQHPQLEISTAPMQNLLSDCDYVATENSSVALYGFFLHKPAVLFAQIDFHHIANSVSNLGAEVAIKSAPAMAPEYDRYLHWFFKETGLNGGAPDVEDQILDMVRRRGWQL